MLRAFRQLAIMVAVVSFAPASWAADPFADFVRSADPRSPEEELKGFHGPEGFEVQLIAAEPDIA